MSLCDTPFDREDDKPMSDIYEIVCDTCKGSGRICNLQRNKETCEYLPALKDLLQDCRHCYTYTTCPTCKGAGGWWLGVKMKCIEIGCLSWEGCIACTSPAKDRIKYRPLTVEEVHEVHIKWIADNRDKYPNAPIKMQYHDRFIHHASRGNLTYKGAQVTLIGRDNAN